ncbi:MoaD/ThiS family protein [Saccharibacter floricola]|uniref:Molybdopterin converting factor small subunit n=1 Tax=Saccharibacter floricola DSM 15669 TaxID=1123227 RepID=A0ABQ0P136_9PROT|nr:MoaD/ThiS family protein [Saccharibacter floricola]GBQ08657.1 molybdopterin converting factor small subunit [Saccharibacter floricola DSM 15669]
MRITLEYFAQLRDLAGCTREERDIEAISLGTLYEQVRRDYQFPLERDQLRVAVNDAFASWDEVPHEGDMVVFIPPVTGG